MLSHKNRLYLHLYLQYLQVCLSFLNTVESVLDNNSLLHTWHLYLTQKLLFLDEIEMKSLPSSFLNFTVASLNLFSEDCLLAVIFEHLLAL